MNKTVKYILIAVVVIAVIALAIWGIKTWLDSRAPTTIPPTGPPVGPSNTIVDILSGLFTGGFFNNLFGGGKKCDPNNPGFQKDGVYNPDKCGTASGFQCDPDKYGYNLQGFPDFNCGFGRTTQTN